MTPLATGGGGSVRYLQVTSAGGRSAACEAFANDAGTWRHLPIEQRIRRSAEAITVAIRTLVATETFAYEQR